MDRQVRQMSLCWSFSRASSGWTTFEWSRCESTNYSLILRKSLILKCADAAKLRWRDAAEIQTIGRDRIKLAERYDDMSTADHEVLNGDQESRLHHKYAMVA